MGLTISSVFTRLFGKKQMRILMGEYCNMTAHRLDYVHCGLISCFLGVLWAVYESCISNSQLDSTPLVKPPYFTSWSWVRLSQPFRRSALMLRRWSTKTSALQYGMSAARTRSGPFGATTTKTHKDSFLWLIQVMSREYRKLKMSWLIW